MDKIRFMLHEGAEVPLIRKGNMADLGVARVAILPNDKAISVKDVPWTFVTDWDVIKVKEGDVLAIDTGISMEMPEGWFAYAVPRSSTFLKFGLILTNSIGVIDHSYKGDNDTWKGFFLCTRNTEIPIDTKLIQFQPIKDTIHDFEMVEVESLDNEDRGGFGSTDETSEPTEGNKVVLDIEAMEDYIDDLEDAGCMLLAADVRAIIGYHNVYDYIPLMEYSNKPGDSQRFRVGFEDDETGEGCWIWCFNSWVLEVKE